MSFHVADADVERADPHVPMWSQLYISTVLFVPVAAVMAAGWWWLSSPKVLGVSTIYLGAAVTLAIAVYGLVVVIDLSERAGSENDPRPLTSFAQDLCRAGRLHRCDLALAVTLSVTTVVLGILAAFTSAEIALPAMLTLMVGTWAGFARPAFDNPDDEVRSKRLRRRRAERDRRIEHARKQPDEPGLVTLDLHRAGPAGGLEGFEYALLDLRWRHTPYSQVNPATRMCHAQILVSLDRYRSFCAREQTQSIGFLETCAERVMAAPDIELGHLADEISAQAREWGLNVLDQAGLALALVQSIPYCEELNASEGMHAPPYPLPVLVERSGDRAGHALLLAAILRMMGLQTLLFAVPPEAGTWPPSPRLAVGIALAATLPGDWYIDRMTRLSYALVEPRPQGAGAEDEVRFGQYPRDWLEPLVHHRRLV